MGMKGFVFTTDVLVGLGLAIIIVLTFVSLRFESSLPEKRYERLNYIAADAVDLLSNLKLRSVTYKPTVKRLMDGGLIKDEDLNKTVLDLIGSLWFGNNQSIAENISREVLEAFNKSCINVTAGLQTIYSSCNKSSQSIAVRSKITSGYEIGRPVSGYISRAIATRTRKNNTLIVKGDVISSSVRKPAAGNNLNEVNVTYDLNIPANALLIDSSWFIEAAYTDNKFKAYINGIYVPGSDTSTNLLIEHIDFNYYNIRPGLNKLTVVYRFGNGGYEGGDDGASHFILNYSTGEVNTLPSREILYFGNVVSRTTIQYKKPVFVAGEINNLNVNMSIKATNATLKFEFEGVTYNISTKNVTDNNVYWNDTEIKTALNQNNITYSNLTTRYFWFIVETDVYQKREELGEERAIYNISYIKINATFRVAAYGFLDITNIVPVYSYSDLDWNNFYRKVEWRFNSSALPLALDSQLAWLYRTYTNPLQNITGNNITLYSHPPSPLIPDLARFAYINTSGEIMNGINSYNLNFSYGYAVNPFNSLADYTVLIPAQVGYGNVFNTTEEAANDAMQRLIALLSKYITPEEVVIQNRSVTGIRWLWGPSLFKVLAWER